MLIEILLDGQFYHVKADVPAFSLNDAQALLLEQHCDPNSPEDLCTKLKNVMPKTQSLEVLKPLEGKNGFRISSSDFDTLPHFRWPQISRLGR